jgi:hypothetical protein
MTERENIGRDPVDPDEFQTFDSFDASLAPPKRPASEEEGEGEENEEAEEETTHEGYGDRPPVTRGVPAGRVMSVVGVLSVAHNRQ